MKSRIDAVELTIDLETSVVCGYAGGTFGAMPFERWHQFLHVTPEKMLEVIRIIHERNPDALGIYVLTVDLEGSDGKWHDLKKVEDIKPGSNRRIRIGLSFLRNYSPDKRDCDYLERKQP